MTHKKGILYKPPNCCLFCHSTGHKSPNSASLVNRKNIRIHQRSSETTSNRWFIIGGFDGGVRDHSNWRLLQLSSQQLELLKQIKHRIAESCIAKPQNYHPSPPVTAKFNQFNTTTMCGSRLWRGKTGLNMFSEYGWVCGWIGLQAVVVCSERVSMCLRLSIWKHQNVSRAVRCLGAVQEEIVRGAWLERVG